MGIRMKSGMSGVDRNTRALWRARAQPGSGLPESGSRQLKALSFECACVRSLDTCPRLARAWHDPLWTLASHEVEAHLRGR